MEVEGELVWIFILKIKGLKNTLLVQHTKLKQKNTLLVLHTKLKPCLLTNFHNNMINRPEYIKQLNDFKDTKIIKVITGMRRLKIIMKK